MSVCSGIEAASVAWEPIGWTPHSFSEVDKFPSAVLAHHWPAVPNLGDMTKFKEWPDANVNVLVGGTPCQSFSVAGLRKGLDDPRGNLMLTYGAIAAKYRPTWLVWENVPGVLSSNGGRDFGTFLGMLGQLGYGFAYRVLDAQYFGVAQRRRRVFVVGYLGDWRHAAAVLFEQHSLSGNPAPSREAGQGFAADVVPSLRGSGPGAARTGDSRGQDPVIGCWWDGGQVSQTLDAVLQKGQTMPEKNRFPAVLQPTHEVVGPMTACGGTEKKHGFGWGQQDWENGYCQPVAIQNATRGKSQNGIGIAAPGDPMYTLDNGSQHGVACAVTGEITHALNTANNGKGSSEDGTGRGGPTVAFHHNAQACPLPEPSRDTSISDPLTASQGAAVAFATQQTPKGWDLERGTCPTLQVPSKSGGGQPHACVDLSMAVRRLTPTECERLQGFPDGHTAIPWRGKPAEQCPDGPRYKAIGNSMAVPVMRWIGERIKLVSEVSA